MRPLALLSLALLACGGDDAGERFDLSPAVRDAADVGAAANDAGLAADAGFGVDAGSGTDAGPEWGDADAAPDFDAPDFDAPDFDAPDFDARDAHLEADAERLDLGPDVADADPPDMGPDDPCPGDMVHVPAGAFLFSPFDERRELPDFCIHYAEVSAAEYLACAADGACDPYDEWALCVEEDERRPHQCRDDRLGYPANWIDWYRAEQYCRWLGARLPTEMEFEKAARGPDGRTWPWGERIDCGRAQYARSEVYDECLGFGPHGDLLAPVESYLEVPSPYGAINLGGNVKEWTEFRDDLDTLPEPEEAAPAKGGGYRDEAPDLRGVSVDRLLGAGRSSRAHGFRCAQSP